MPGLDDTPAPTAGQSLPMAALTDAGRILALEGEVQQLREALAQAQRQKHDDEMETLSLTVAGPPGSKPRTERILVVEDHPFDRRVTHLMLTSLGYTPDHAATGQEALAAMERKRYDIVLMDVQMPRLDGIETTRSIRERWPGNTGPRIIALTSRSMKGDREVCLAAGMDDYLSKPVPLRMLDAKLRSEIQPLVDRKQLARCAEMMGAPAVGRMIESFLTDLPGLMAEMFQALMQHRSEDLAEHVATLRGSCEILGVPRVSAPAMVLQRLALGADLGKAATVLSLIEVLQTPLEKELRELRPLYV